jgi:hypothetical protein
MLMLVLAPPHLAAGSHHVTLKSLAALHGAAGCNAGVPSPPALHLGLLGFVLEVSLLSSGVKYMNGVIL